MKKVETLRKIVGIEISYGCRTMRIKVYIFIFSDKQSLLIFCLLKVTQLMKILGKNLNRLLKM